MQITDPKQIHDYYQALLNRDDSYLGSFIVGVKTTNIFCIATCRARKPKFENVEFFSGIKDALNAGYRPCKVCKPTSNSFDTPDEVRQALKLVQENPKQKITDYQLRQQNIKPENLRRWFKKHYGMTFQSYQRMFRINNAFQELQQGKSATDIAMDNGYDSLSGFGYTFKKVIGRSPKNAAEQHVILISRFETPIGPMFICATDKGVCLVEFVDRRMLETEFKDLQKRLNANIIVGENCHIQLAKQQLQEYFEGTRTRFDLSLDAPGTQFQQQVWEMLQTIPYGDTRSYQAQAEAINNPKAVRAVASANGMNRIGIIIPCHRVIGKDGSLTGYGGGLERKRWLLEHESKKCDFHSNK